MTRKDLTNKDWWIEVGIRAGKTAAQTALSMLTIGQMVTDVNWLNLISISTVAGAVSILTSITVGLEGKK